MINKDKIELIKSIDESITYNDEINVFILNKLDKWDSICKELKNNDQLNFNYLMCITSIDLIDENLSLAYNLHSTILKESIEFNLVFNQNESIPSVASIWKTANWHEREAYDMMGIKFSNHPNMKRILLPDDWEGHPLKKNYEVADYYHGMYIPKDKTEWE